MPYSALHMVVLNCAKRRFFCEHIRLAAEKKVASHCDVTILRRLLEVRRSIGPRLNLGPCTVRTGSHSSHWHWTHQSCSRIKIIGTKVPVPAWHDITLSSSIHELLPDRYKLATLVIEWVLHVL